MELSAKLQMKPGQRLVQLGAADDVPVLAAREEEPAAAPGAGEVIVAFVRTRADLATSAAVTAIDAARSDRPAWIAYPKAGKLDTDLNRDVLREALAGHGVRPVRQIAVDDVWSAMRFRPA
ncbi:hypothetical protein [Streptomyces sp. NPDC058157]|uniref:hypothetical protein n=1 Tax=Streptomyces sp. NPDC058157 TaxID=3346360 RepID=UPI0036E45347